MFRIGCHLSSSKGYLAMGRQAVEIGANTFQFFSRNPRGGAVKPLDLKDVEAYRAFAEEHDIRHILVHAPYTLNACADVLNRFLWPEMQTTVLRETMAGKGSEVGRSFEELRAIIDRVELKDKLGVCLDTCHIWEGGYDIIGDTDGVLRSFDEIVGLERLRGVHLNDSKNPVGAHKDRHEKIGEGSLGTEVIARIINHPALRELPFYLETPNEIDGYAREIALLKQLYQD